LVASGKRCSSSKSWGGLVASLFMKYMFMGSREWDAGRNYAGLSSEK
jgi:hypothetical protein